MKEWLLEQGGRPVGGHWELQRNGRARVMSKGLVTGR